MREEGYEDGKADGIKIGKADGIKIGKADGIKIGKADGIKIGKADGIKIGKADGIKIGIAQSIIWNLKKCGSLPEELRSLIMSRKDMDTLQKWLEIASSAKSIEDFKKKIALGK